MPAGDTGDAEGMVTTAGLLPLLQLCDSALPTGAFAHTFGLETYLARGTVHDETTFADWLGRFLDHQLAHADGLAVRLTAEAVTTEAVTTKAVTTEAVTAADGERGAAEGLDDTLITLDALLHAQALPAQVRAAGVTMGRRLIEIGRIALPGPLIERYGRLVDTGRCHAHQAIAFALVGADHGVPTPALTSAYLFTTVTTLTQNAVRGIPIGQNAGQRVLASLRPRVAVVERRIRQLSADDLGAIPPGLEIAQMQHETQRARMFMS